MDSRRLVSERTTVGYQQDFRNLFMALSSNLNHEEWKELYRKLIYWELEMARSDSSEMMEVLQSQKAEANTEFYKFVSKIRSFSVYQLSLINRLSNMSTKINGKIIIEPANKNP